MIAVVGAGIGGLTAAVALARQGLDCTVFERAPSTVGFGIQVPPDAVRVLDQLGLGGALAAAGVRLETREIRRWQDDTTIARIDLGPSYYALRRRELHRLLLDGVLGSVFFGRRCVSVEVGECLRFADGTSFAADTVIGADGLHSVVRSALWTDAVRDSGHTVHRAVIPASRVPWLAGPPRVIVWLGPRQHIVCYPIDAAGSLNVVATGPLTAYDDWNPVVRALLAAAGSIVHHGLFDRPPLPRWHRGRVALLGDAAHPMLPFLAQGAAQAIQDGAAIAESIRRTGGFDWYETQRRPHVERVLAAVAAAERDHHLPDGAAQELRDDHYRFRKDTKA